LEISASETDQKPNVLQENIKMQRGSRLAKLLEVPLQVPRARHQALLRLLVNGQCHKVTRKRPPVLPATHAMVQMFKRFVLLDPIVQKAQALRQIWRLVMCRQKPVFGIKNHAHQERPAQALQVQLRSKPPQELSQPLPPAPPPLAQQVSTAQQVLLVPCNNHAR